MPTLSQAKTLGGVGSILGLLGIAPSVGPVLSIAGLIMTLVAVKYISDVLADKRIFNNMIISVILGIGGIIVLVAFVFAAIARFIGVGNLFGATPSVPPTIPASDIISLIASLAIGLLAAWVLIVISAVFLRMSYKSVAARLNVGLFGTAALLYLIGAALTIILVGFVLIFVAQILLVVAFFSLPDAPPTPPSGTAPMTTTG